VSDLEHLADALSDENSSVTVLFTPKYHCELAGEGVEYLWGFCKKNVRRMPFERRRELISFVTEVKTALTSVKPVRMQRFRKRCRKYMLAYHAIVAGYAEENGIGRDAEEAILALARRTKQSKSWWTSLAPATKLHCRSNREERSMSGVASARNLPKKRHPKRRSWSGYD